MPSPGPLSRSPFWRIRRRLTLAQALCCLLLLDMGCLRHRPEPERAAVLISAARPDLDAVLLHPSERRLAHILQLTSSHIMARHPVQSADGALVAYEASLVQSTNRCSQIFMIDADGFDDHLVSTGDMASAPFFAPSSTLLLYTQRDGGAPPCSPTHDKTSPHGHHASRAQGSSSPAHATLSPGRLVSHNIARGQVASPAGAESLAGQVIQATYSADARHLAIVAIDPQTSDTAIHLLDTRADDAPRQLLIPPQAHAPLDVSFDPTGQSLLFTAQPDPTRPHVREIFTWGLDDERLTQLTHDHALHTGPIFHPDGIHILFSSNLDTRPGHPRRDIFMMQRDGRHLERITFAEGSHTSPNLAAQGARLSFTSTRDKRGETRTTSAVFVADFLSHPMQTSLRLRGQAAIERQSLKSRIDALSDPRMEGREAGTSGEKSTLEYLTKQFEFAGLLPHPSLGSLLQEFPFEVQHPSTEQEPARLEQRTASNVIGWLPARADGQPTREVLILGAHHDHAGLGKSWLALDDTSRDMLHPGADDNASGIAALLEIAEAMQGIEERERDVLFVAFGAEEYGLEGSKHLIASGLFAPSDIVAMINLDMVGRLEHKPLIVRGDESAPQWRALIRRHHPIAGLDIAFEDVGKGNTDFIPFFQRDVPIIGLFTGHHEDYHRPGDTPDKIDYEGLEKIVNFATLLARELVQSPRRPTFYTESLQD